MREHRYRVVLSVAVGLFLLTVSAVPTGASPAGPAGTVNVAIRSAAGFTKTVGDVFAVDIQLEGSDPVGGADVWLTFDPTYLVVVDSAGNPTTTAGILDGLMPRTKAIIDNTTGVIKYSAGYTDPDQSLPTPNLLCSVRFKALAATAGTPLDLVSGRTLVIDASGSLITGSLIPGVLLVVLPPAAPTVTLARVGNDLTLTWQHLSQNTSYTAWRGTTPYFAITDSGVLTLASCGQNGNTFTCTDPGAALSGVNYFYFVQAMNAAGAQAASNRVGTFGFVFSVPSVPPAAPIVTIARVGNDLTLTWQHLSQNTSYTALRGPTPYFAVTDPAVITLASCSQNGSTYTCTDPGAALPGVNAFYIVRATNATQSWAESNRVGKFEFSIQPGS